MRILNKSLLLILLSLSLSSCGFQFRNHFKLPYQQIEIKGDYKTLETVNLIKRYINDNTQYLENEKADSLSINILKEEIDKRILSLSASGKVREYTYYYILTYELKLKTDPKVYTHEVVVRRDLSYSDKDVLSKESEEQIMYKDMRRDAVNQLIRKLTIIKL